MRLDTFSIGSIDPIENVSSLICLAVKQHENGR
jgi:hypothetical protein